MYLIRIDFLFIQHIFNRRLSDKIEITRHIKIMIHSDIS